MEIQLEKGEFPKTTSILVSQKGKMVYEKYFGDGRLELLNDTRSVTKSITDRPPMFVPILELVLCVNIVLFSSIYEI